MPVLHADDRQSCDAPKCVMQMPFGTGDLEEWFRVCECIGQGSWDSNNSPAFGKLVLK